MEADQCREYVKDTMLASQPVLSLKSSVKASGSKKRHCSDTEEVSSTKKYKDSSDTDQVVGSARLTLYGITLSKPNTDST